MCDHTYLHIFAINFVHLVLTYPVQGDTHDALTDAIAVKDICESAAEKLDGVGCGYNDYLERSCNLNQIFCGDCNQTLSPSTNVEFKFSSSLIYPKDQPWKGFKCACLKI